MRLEEIKKDWGIKSDKRNYVLFDLKFSNKKLID